MIEYFKRKQFRLLNFISFDFVRKKYFDIINSDERLIGIIGSRGIGKTYVFLQYLKKLPADKSLYIAGDDIIFSNSSIIDIVDEFYSLNGRYLLIDEIHKYPNWVQEIKNIYDSYPDLIIRFTGSSMLNIVEEQYDLSRRAVIIRMPILSFKEYLELKFNINLPELTTEKILKDSIEISNNIIAKYPYIYSEFKKYLKSGCYPFFKETEEFYNEKLINALLKVINEDIPSITRIKYEHLYIFKKLIFKLVQGRVPYKLNILSIAREFNVTPPTLYNYLDILDSTGIFQLIKKYSKKTTRKPEKILFSNPNIHYAFSEEYGIESDIGTIRECFFVSNFDKIFYSDKGDFIYKEFVFEIGGKKKRFNQIKDKDNSYAVTDTDITVTKNKIPLWIFGFLY